MPDPTKPGQDAAPAGTTEAPPPVEAATTPETPPQEGNQPPPSTQAQEVQTQAETLPATQEEFQRRLEAERKRVMDDVRAKAGREAGWLGDPRAQGLTDEEKQEILNGGYRTAKAKLDAYERTLAATGQKPAETKPDPGPDPLEKEVAELCRLAEKKEITPQEFYRGMAEVNRRIARREAEAVHEAKFRPSHERMTRQQQTDVVAADPRMKDPTFRRQYHGIMVDARIEGRPQPMPLEALEQAGKELNRPAATNGNGHQTTPATPAQPKVTPAFGETRVTSQPQAAPSRNLAERFAKTPSGSRMLP